jgi:hypothetical protein
MATIRDKMGHCSHGSFIIVLSRKRTPVLGANHHRRRPSHALWHGGAGSDWVVRGLCERRHCRQPDHSAYAEHHCNCQQPCRRQPLRHHRQRCSGYGLLDLVRGWHADCHPGRVDDHGQQPDQSLRRRAADADGQLQRLRQWRHLGEPDSRPMQIGRRSNGPRSAPRSVMSWRMNYPASQKEPFADLERDKNLLNQAWHTRLRLPPVREVQKSLRAE